MTPKNTENAKVVKDLEQIEKAKINHPTTQSKVPIDFSWATRPRFETSKVTVNDIPQSTKAGRKSIWLSVIQEANSLKDGEVLKFTVQKQNQISSLRATVKNQPTGLHLTTRTLNKFNSITNITTTEIEVYISKSEI